MSCLQPVCCLCLKKSNKMSHYLLNPSEDNLTYYEKLSTSLPQLVFNKNYDDYMLCVQCCNNINSIYEFSNRCIKNLDTFLHYKAQLNSSKSDSSELISKTETSVNFNNPIEPDKSTKRERDVMAHRNITENEISHSIHNVKLEPFDESYDSTQNCINLKSDSNVCLEMKLVQDIKREPQIKQCGQATDMLIQEDVSENVWGDTNIKIEKDEKSECLDYEFIACDDELDFCPVKEDNHSAQNQPGSSGHTEPRINQSCEPHPSDLNNDESTNTTSLLNQLSNTNSEEVNDLRIPRHTGSEKEAFQQSGRSTTPTLHPSYVCEVCDKIFKCLGNLVKHRVVHSGLKPFSCDVCSKEFTRSSNLARHKIIHTGHKPYSCDICNKAFSQSSSLASHKLNHTDQKPYFCEICKKGFSQPSSLAAHKLTHTTEKCFVCDICNKGFRQSGNLASHRLIHTGQRPYGCTVCDKTFRQPANLARHELIHTGEKPYVCDVCNKAFSQSSSLASHKLIHTGQKPYVCHICGKDFNQLGSLTKHKLIHTGQKPYVCGVCSKAFRHTSSLSKHKLLHTGEQPYACGFCDKRFTQSANLTKHELIHTGMKPHVCDICHRGFNQSSHLATHKILHIDQYKKNNTNVK